MFEAAFAASPGSGYVLPDRSPFLSSCWVYHQLGRAGWYYLEAFQLEVTAPGLVRVQRAVFVMFALLCVVLLLLFAYLLVGVEGGAAVLALEGHQVGVVLRVEEDLHHLLVVEVFGDGPHQHQHPHLRHADVLHLLHPHPAHQR